MGETPRRTKWAQRTAGPLLGAFGQHYDVRERLGQEVLTSIIREQLPPYEAFEVERMLVAQADAFARENEVPYHFAFWMSVQFQGDLPKMRESLETARRIEREEREAGKPAVTPLQGEDWSSFSGQRYAAQVEVSPATDDALARASQASRDRVVATKEERAKVVMLSDVELQLTKEGKAPVTADEKEALLFDSLGRVLSKRVEVDAEYDQTKFIDAALDRAGEVIGEVADEDRRLWREAASTWKGAESLGNPVGAVMDMIEMSLDKSKLDMLMPPSAARKFAEKAGRKDLVALADKAAEMGCAIRLFNGEMSIVDIPDEGTDSDG